jgi:hypothetical protein
MSARTTTSEGDSRAEEAPGETAGVDVTLIDEMLRLSPGDRLRQNDRVAALAIKLREAFLSTGDKWKSRDS